MIGIVSYGVGNVRAFARIYERFGFDVAVTGSPEVLRRATHLILPGVGAFDSALQRLQAAGLREVLDDLVLVRRRPILGVCVGMQMMAGGSEEGVLPGLGWIPGHVRQICADRGGEAMMLPHMGWNDIIRSGDPLFEGIPHDAPFYFLHSFHLEPADAAYALARTEYGDTFVCAVRRDNVVGVQFHPEKSHGWGEQLLLNFARA